MATSTNDARRGASRFSSPGSQRGAMRTALLVLGFCVLGSIRLIAAQQSYTQDIVFAGVPWESPKDSVRRLLRARGYVFERTDEDGDQWYAGQLAGQSVKVIALYTASGKLAKIIVALSPPRHRVREVYRDFKESLTE